MGLPRTGTHMKRLQNWSKRPRVAALLVISTCVLSVAQARDPDFNIDMSVKSYYTSNLFRVTEEREDQFDSKDGVGERFHDMKGPDDFVTRPGIDLEWKWDVAKKRDFRISFGADYYIHARNTIADYLCLQGAVAYDLTRDDEVGLGVEFIPDRFRKNLSLEDEDTGDKTFRRADYQQFSIAPWYLHDWNKDWSTEVQYEYSNRSYDSPFENRDRECHTVTALVKYAGFKRVDIALGVGYSTTDIPQSTEFGIEVDRSHDDLLAELEVDLNLPHRWEAEFGVEYRNREYASNEPADTGHFDRSDDRWTVEASVGRWVRKDLFLALELGWALNDSARVDKTIEPDEQGYEEYRIGLMAEYQF